MLLAVKKRMFVTGAVVFLTILGVSSANADSAKGAELFEENCVACHGESGVPNLPGAPDFSKGERLEKTDVELLKSINAGLNGVMPPWNGILSENEMKSCLDHLKTFFKKL